MASKTADTERLAAMMKRREELLSYISRFEDAFDELHTAVVKQVKIPGQYVGPHHDYPTMSVLDSGFPSFHDSGFYNDKAPRDYVGTLRPRGLIGILAGYQRPEVGFPMGAELAAFLRSHEIGKRLKLSEHMVDGKPFDWPVDHLVGDAVERYLHLHGLEAPIDPGRRTKVIRPLVFGTVQKALNLRLVVPITMTRFDVDRFRLSETTYITRIPEKIQLARARMSTMGSGAVKSVVGAATHAFVSNGWNLEVDSIGEVSGSLSQTSSNVIDALESFFGALRVATGISTGYAQILWIPQQWALSYYCDLTPIYGTTLRQYPSHFDRYGWTREGSSVSAAQLREVQRIYRAVVASDSEAVRLALRRLNACLTRTDPADAILDGTIGLELLLGDDQNQSLSYKLRLRAGALALLHGDSAYPAADVAANVRRLYSSRSTIVHGRRKKSSKKAAEPENVSHEKDRDTASELLRFVLDVLLAYPKYQDPTKIDEGLLLRGDVASHPKRRKRRRKKVSS